MQLMYIVQQQRKHKIYPSKLQRRDTVIEATHPTHKSKQGRYNNNYRHNMYTINAPNNLSPLPAIHSNIKGNNKQNFE